MASRKKIKRSDELLAVSDEPRCFHDYYLFLFHISNTKTYNSLSILVDSKFLIHQEEEEEEKEEKKEPKPTKLQTYKVETSSCSLLFLL